MRLMLDSLTFIVLVFHFCPIYLKKKKFEIHLKLTALEPKRQKKKERKGTDYRERAGQKKERRRRKKEEEEEERKQRKLTCT